MTSRVRKESRPVRKADLPTVVDVRSVCDLVLPCRDEAAALPGLLPAVPRASRSSVVDNGSTRRDRRGGARARRRVVDERVPGYGAAVHAGLLAATGEYVAFMDGDGSFDPHELVPLLAEVRSGRADLAVGGAARSLAACGRGTPGSATTGRVAGCAGGSGFPAHDIAPMRVAGGTPCWRSTSGPAVRLSGGAAAEGNGGRVAGRRAGRRLPPACRGTRSKVSGSVRGTIRAARDFWRVLA